MAAARHAAVPLFADAAPMVTLSRADSCSCRLQYAGDNRFSVAPPTSTNSMDGLYAQGVITKTYTQVQETSNRESRGCCWACVWALLLNMPVLYA